MRPGSGTEDRSSGVQGAGQTTLTPSPRAPRFSTVPAKDRAMDGVQLLPQKCKSKFEYDREMHRKCKPEKLNCQSVVKYCPVYQDHHASDINICPARMVPLQWLSWPFVIVEGMTAGSEEMALKIEVPITRSVIVPGILQQCVLGMTASLTLCALLKQVSIKPSG